MLYLHIGMHKTGTTFLQNEVFPAWEGIHYIPLDKLEYLLRMDDTESYLLSREGLSGQNWMHFSERKDIIERLARHFPDAQILMSFRKHSGFIASSYTQYLQRGGFMPFSDYFDLAGNSARMRREDFLFENYITAVEKAFGRKPFLMLHEEILNDLDSVLGRLEKFMGGARPADIGGGSKKYNKSVGYYPSKLLRFLNKRSRTQFNPDGKYNLYHWKLKKYGLDPRSICQYRLSFLPYKSLLSDTQKNDIDNHYREDWEYVLAYQGLKNAGDSE